MTYNLDTSRYKIKYSSTDTEIASQLLWNRMGKENGKIEYAQHLASSSVNGNNSNTKHIMQKSVTRFCSLIFHSQLPDFLHTSAIIYCESNQIGYFNREANIF